MYRNVCSLFQLRVFLLSCPRHAFAIFVRALFPTCFTTLLAPSSQMLCDGKEHRSPPLPGQGRFCGTGSLSWALRQWNSLGKVQQESALWLHGSLVLASTCTFSTFSLQLALNINPVGFLLIMARFKWVPLGDQTAHHVNCNIPTGQWCLGLLLNNGLNSEQLWRRSKLAIFYPLPCSLLWSFFLSHSLTQHRRQSCSFWACAMGKAVKFSVPMSCERSTLLLQEERDKHCCHILHVTSPRQTLSFNLGLSGKLKQRAMKQVHELVYLKRCVLHIWR